MSALGVWPRSRTVRLLAGATLANAFGNGLFTVGSLLFFTRVLGLWALGVAAGLTVAGIVGLASSVPIGAVADRLGHKRLLQTLWLLQAVATLLFLTTRSIGYFTGVAIAYTIGQKAARGVNNALIADTAAPSERVAVRAYLRSTNNLGLSLGALAGGAAVAADTGAAYAALFVTDVVTFLAAVLAIARLEAPAARSSGPRPRSPSAIRDLRYLRVTGLNGVLSLQYSVLTLILPLWVVDRTAAPHWIMPVLLALNTGLVVVWQTRASRPIGSTRSAGRYLGRAGMLFFVSVLAIAGADFGAPTIAIVLLLIGTLVHTIAEMWHAAASFEVSVALAEPHRHGEYQAVFGLGTGIAESLAPMLLVVLCIGLGLGGWIVVAVALLASGLLMARLLDGGRAAARETEVLVDAYSSDR